MSTRVHEGDAVGSPASAAVRREVRRDLQGLRGLGVSLVVIGHLWRWPPGVYTMLDIFFVLSGFLITGVLLDSVRHYGGISFAQFYLSRVRRLMPMAVLVVLVTTAATYLVYSSARGASATEDGLWALVFGINWHFVATSTDYFAESAASPLLHYWSLSVEEQFYLVWPALVMVTVLAARRLRASSTTVLVVVMGLVTAASFAYSMWHSTASPGAAYFSTFDRVWEFGVGGLIAATRSWWGRMPDRVAIALSWGATLSLGLPLFLLTYGHPFPAPWGLAVVVPIGVIVACGIGRETRRLWLVDNGPLVYVGNISYSLYLWHLPVNVILLAFLAHTSPWYYVVAVTVSVALAVASYHLVERPLRYAPALMTWRERDHFADRAPKPGIVRGAVVASVASVASVAVIVALSGVLTPAPEGPEVYVEARTSPTTSASSTPQDTHEQQLVAALRSTRFPAFSPPLRDLGSERLFDDLYRTTCISDTASKARACEADLPPPQRTALLFGDSFADAWSPGIRAALEPQGWGVQVMAKGACPSWTLPSYVNTDGTAYDGCRDLHRLLMDTVRTRPPGLVVLATAALQVRNAKRPELGTTPVEVAHDGLTRTIRQLRAAGVSRIVVLGSPPLLKDLRECVTRLGTPSRCVGEPQPSYADYLRGERTAAAEAGVPFIDTQGWFCRRDRCPAFVGRTPVTADGAHLTMQYSRQLAPLLGPALLSGY